MCMFLQPMVAKMPLTLPLSPILVFLGQLDLFLDVFSLISTISITRSYLGYRLCGVEVASFFQGCVIAMCLLIVGNQLSQGIIAVRYARRCGQDPVCAFMLGITNLDLAHLMFSHQLKPSSDRTAACLALKMNELAWEAALLVLSWTVMLARIGIEMITKISCLRAPLKPVEPWLMYMQPISAGVGVVSLSLGVVDFVRLHPSSFWAYENPPAKTVLFIIDWDPQTWCRSLFIGVWSGLSVANHAFIYIALILITYVTNALYIPHSLYYMVPEPTDRERAVFFHGMFWGIVGGLFVFHVLVHVGMKSWRIIPTSIISMFVNIPWVAAKDPTSTWGGGPRSSWPSWILAFGHAAMVVTFVSITETTFIPMSFAHCGGKQQTIRMPQTGATVFGGPFTSINQVDSSDACKVGQKEDLRAAYSAGTWWVIVLVAMVGIELVLFLTISGIVARKRARHEVIPPTSVPAIVYGGGLLSQTVHVD